MNSRPYGMGQPLIFAPMEGVTDLPYRMAMAKLYPEWDFYSTDFFRVPTVGLPNAKRIKEHYGEAVLNSKNLKEKTTYQILTSARAQTEDVVKIIEGLDVPHLDLNIGCPSKKVNAHKGGAYLLSDLEELKKILKKIRSNFSNYFTVKIRIGYKDDSLFFDLLKLFEDEGVDGITLHARTRDQLYKGIADWDYIEKAVKASNLPIIGNGDIWNVHDIDKMINQCGCAGVMIGRGALKTPWLATLYYEHKDNLDFISDEYLLSIRKENLEMYFYELEKEFSKTGLKEGNIHKRFKSFSRYLFDDYENSESVRANFLRSTSLDEFKDHLDRL